MMSGSSQLYRYRAMIRCGKDGANNLARDFQKKVKRIYWLKVILGC